jgi:hypothetical protein
VLICGAQLEEPSKKSASASADQPAVSQETIPPQLAAMLPSLPPEAAAIVVKAVMHAGPIPSPELLGAYPDDIQSKIIEWADSQHKHRLALEVTETAGNQARMNRGQWMTGGIALASIVAAAIAAVLSRTWIAPAFIVVAGVGGPTGASALGQALAALLARQATKAEPPPARPKRISPTKKGRLRRG